ncbi:MAG: pyrroline-5-carboxylate reductase [Marinilabiliales bacterium]|nr:MAG: pyrroline-5-carboxylate reductase [Marinilabiliales bacterium]
MDNYFRNHRIAVIGAGNIGLSLASGFLQSGLFSPGNICLTRRRIDLLSDIAGTGVQIMKDNARAVEISDIVIISVEPQQINGVLQEIRPVLNKDRHTVISVVTGVTIHQIEQVLGQGVYVVRAMPNIAISVGESMTCVAGNGNLMKPLDETCRLFEIVGRTLVINEDEMIAATAIGACGVAFFLRAIRAASQGGIEIGLQSRHALTIAIQAAKGAASLLLSGGSHPEQEIDKVTTPKGCTIAGLNLMEYEGFSSAMIKGISLSAEKAAHLYKGDNIKNP